MGGGRGSKGCSRDRGSGDGEGDESDDEEEEEGGRFAGGRERIVGI